MGSYHRGAFGCTPGATSGSQFTFGAGIGPTREFQIYFFIDESFEDVFSSGLMEWFWKRVPFRWALIS